MPTFTKIVNSSLRCDTRIVYVQLNESQQRKNVTTNIMMIALTQQRLTGQRELFIILVNLLVVFMYRTVQMVKAYFGVSMFGCIFKRHH